ncbi:uncharacterized protein LOC129599044 [Paramacrobiotus metropolitanus]|uniref:uncharacterized protein LOC129599044 n=1 Tax=Paramacrobiotus metropolitanus TaxID=2943436 RepID=UPI0024459216|nr:uncharacterized protein LOC129599044 [Paramacrobiotus metropolitanus]
MKSTAGFLSLWTTATVLLQYSTAESGDPTVESGPNTINAKNVPTEKPSDTRSIGVNILQTISKCSDPLMTHGCRDCEMSCANPNPSALCAYLCDRTCICKPGLYRTFIPSPTCAPPNGPLLNNCKVASRKVKG